MVGEHGNLLIWCHGPAVCITAHGAGQHDTGTIVVFKRNGPVQSAGAQQCPLGIYTPKNLSWLAGVGHGDVI